MLERFQRTSTELWELFLFSRRIYATGYMRNQPYNQVSIMLRTHLQTSTLLMKCHTAIAGPRIGIGMPYTTAGQVDCGAVDNFNLAFTELAAACLATQKHPPLSFPNTNNTILNSPKHPKHPSTCLPSPPPPLSPSRPSSRPLCPTSGTSSRSRTSPSSGLPSAAPSTSRAPLRRPTLSSGPSRTAPSLRSSRRSTP